MKVQRLFHVLVVMSAAGCDSGDDDGDSRRSGDPDVDAAVGSGSGSGSGSADEGAPCFCDQEACCDRSVEPAEVADGFVCCWSTTCP